MFKPYKNGWEPKLSPEVAGSPDSRVAKKTLTKDFSSKKLPSEEKKLLKRQQSSKKQLLKISKSGKLYINLNHEAMKKNTHDRQK